MDGVTILLTEEMLLATGFNWEAFFIAFACIAIFGVLLSVILNRLEENKIITYCNFIFSLLISLIVGILLGFNIPTPDKSVTVQRYKVTIDETVSFEEFTNNYEIINQEGKIYTVMTKDDYEQYNNTPIYCNDWKEAKTTENTE